MVGTGVGNVDLHALITYLTKVAGVSPTQADVIATKMVGDNPRRMDDTGYSLGEAGARDEEVANAEGKWRLGVALANAEATHQPRPPGTNIGQATENLKTGARVAKVPTTPTVKDLAFMPDLSANPEYH